MLKGLMEKLEAGGEFNSNELEFLQNEFQTLHNSLVALGPRFYLAEQAIYSLLNKVNDALVWRSVGYK